jgi:4-hydroxy-2-oxovalerate aldolase
MREPVRLVETTLRDGTYELDFQFTPADTALIAEALDRAGCAYIEVAHGNGFGTDRWAKPSKLPRAAAPDEAHLEAARSVMRSAKLGTIVVVGPEFTPPSALKVLKDLGVDFVRLAYFPDNIYTPDTLAYITAARELGFIVSINLMQTYVLSAAQVAERAEECARRGANWFYVVDSAGGMSQGEVQDYVRAIVQQSGLIVGLHAHNNLGMAIANSLAAIDAGAGLVDSTLQGIGRATGNASTEQMLLLLQRSGHEPGIARDPILRLGDLARGLFAEKGNDPLHFVSGAARMHSRYVPALVKHAATLGLSAREFLHQFGRLAPDLTAVEAPSAELIAATAAATESASVDLSEAALALAARELERCSEPSPASACDLLFARAGKRRKRTVLHLVAEGQPSFRGPLPWETTELTGLTVPVADLGALSAVGADRQPDILVLDDRLGPSPTGMRSLVLRLHQPSIIADAVADLVELLGPAATHFASHDPISQLAAARLRERGLPPTNAPSTSQRLLVAATIEDAESARLSAGDTLIVHGAADPAAVDRARAAGVTVLRPLLGPVIAGRVAALRALSERLRGPRVAVDLEGVRCVDALVAAGVDEATLDDLAAPAHLLEADEAMRARALRAAAGRRALALRDGRGRL